MSRPAIVAEPGAASDPARGDARTCQLEAVDGAAVEGALYLDLPRHAVRAAERQIAAAVHREARVTTQRLGQHVREETLREPATVELEARRAQDRPAARICPQ